MYPVGDQTKIWRKVTQLVLCHEKVISYITYQAKVFGICWINKNWIKTEYYIKLFLDSERIECMHTKEIQNVSIFFIITL